MESNEQGTSAGVRTSRNNLGIPVAIVIASVLIAGAIIYTGMQKGPAATAPTNNGNTPAEDIEVAPVTEKDHIRGNPNAPIVIVEYSDFDCPFCKNFHETMQQVMDQYGANGQVAWVYRHFPLEQLHPNAPKLAAASECVAELGGNDAFWKFADLIFGERGTNEPTNMTRLPDFAEQSGVSKERFNECVENGTYDTAIDASIEEAIKTGARGTPYSILIVGDQQGVINGAQPYATVKQMLDTVIAQMAGQNQ